MDLFLHMHQLDLIVSEQLVLIPALTIAVSAAKCIYSQVLNGHAIKLTFCFLCVSMLLNLAFLQNKNGFDNPNE